MALSAPARCEEQAIHTAWLWPSGRGVARRAGAATLRLRRRRLPRRRRLQFSRSLRRSCSRARSGRRAQPSPQQPLRRGQALLSVLATSWLSTERGVAQSVPIARASALRETLPTRQDGQPAPPSGSVRLRARSDASVEISRCRQCAACRAEPAHGGMLRSCVRDAAVTCSDRVVVVHKKYAPRPHLRLAAHQQHVGAAAPLQRPFS